MDGGYFQAFMQIFQKPMTTPDVAIPIVEHFGNNLGQVDQALAHVINNCVKPDGVYFFFFCLLIRCLLLK
jgi:hypothetical protein